MKASIIIPTFNRIVFTRICVQHLSSAFVDSSGVEVVVVDNGSKDGTPDYLRTLGPPFRVILNKTNRGFAGACNQGAEAAIGATLVFLNNDTVPLDGWLDPLLETLEQKDVGIVGSKLLFPDDTIQHAGVVMTPERLPAHIYYQFPGYYPEANVEREYQAVTGACLALRRSLFEKLGAFDEGYRNSFEDIDLCMRARMAGKRVIYSPKSTIYHFESVTEGRHDRDEENRVRFLSLWKNSVVPDQIEWYRRDGFTSVPRVPYRTFSQALSQMQLERRRAESLFGMVTTLEKVLNSTDASGASRVPRCQGTELHVETPRVMCGGAEKTVDAQLVQSESDVGFPASLRYEWKRRGGDVASWGGEAARLPSRRALRTDMAAKLLVPSISGEYELSWNLEANGKKLLLARQNVTVATRFDIECSARLPMQPVAGEQYRVIARVKNTGAEPWLPYGGFSLSYHWFDKSGSFPLDWEGCRTPILERVAPGEETVLDAVIVMPAQAGRYQFLWDAVCEGESWFSAVGTPPRREEVDVRPDDGDTPSVHAEVPHSPSLQPTVSPQQNDAKITQLESILRSRETTLRSLEHELRTRQLDLEAMGLRAREADAKAAQMYDVVQAFERGRVMRLLATLSRWRNRGIRFRGN